MEKSKEVTGYRLIVGYLGVFMMLIGIIVLIPIVNIIFEPGDVKYLKCFLIPGLSSILIGFLLNLFIFKKEKGHLKRHQDSVLVVLTWIITITVAAMPFVLTGEYTFTQAMFEATSGFSTTGLTVVDVDNCAKTLLLYRSIMLFFGGIGLILVLTSAFSDAHGMQLYTAEGHSDKLMPNLKKSARMIFSIYSCYMVLGVVLFVIFGMNFFDALNHSISAFSTGGFCTHKESIGYYNSMPIEMVSILLMLLGCTNYVVHFQILHAKFGKALKHCEIKSLTILFILLVPLMALDLFKSVEAVGNYGEAFRISAFHFVSAITTTGFQTVSSMAILPPFALIVTIFIMLIGGGIGSTAGGIKQYRLVVVAKGAYYNFRDKISNKRLTRTHFINRYGKDEILTQKEYSDSISYIVLYLALFFVGTLIYTAYGYPLEDSAFEIASAISSAGLSRGIISASAPPLILWTSIAEMFLGRLEIVVVFFAFYRIGCDLVKKEV